MDWLTREEGREFGSDGVGLVLGQEMAGTGDQR
jgi:hypothetical protein